MSGVTGQFRGESWRRYALAAVAAALTTAGLGRPAAAQLLPPGATAALLTASSGAFAEGPLYDEANNRILFTDLQHNPRTILAYDLTTHIRTVAVANSGGANGMYFDSGGHVVSADRDLKRISRRSPTDLSVEEVLATTWNGNAFIGPNDLVIDFTGGVYFTDPNYGGGNPTQGVYYRDAAGVVSRLLTGFSKPNGIVLSPDGAILYLAVEGEQRIMAYDVTAPGVLANPRQFAATNVAPLPTSGNGPDGLTIDPAGNVYAAVQNAIHAWNPAGQRILSLSVGMDPTNVEFGGHNRKTLFITAGNSLYSVGLNVVPALPGDADYDGDVDADDLVVWTAEAEAWEDGAGPTGAALNSDANGDGVADGADLLAWQQHLAIAGEGVTLAAPEPSAFVLIAANFALLGVGRRVFRS